MVCISGRLKYYTVQCISVSSVNKLMGRNHGLFSKLNKLSKVNRC